MKTNQHKPEWTLWEIANWSHTDSKVSIPSIQRGLVWKPQQVELLWDSILRQFPIGAFTLSVSQKEGDHIYSLLDGQQRWNAISLGYGTVTDEVASARSILWFDLKPEGIWNPQKTTRKFFIRVTTKAHPWGYEANDDCGRFNTEQKRLALEQLGLNGKNIYNEEISLGDTYPVRSGLPVPLFWLLEAGKQSNGDPHTFAEYIYRKIQDNKKTLLFKLKENDIPFELLEKYRPSFEAVVNYFVPTIYLEQNIIDGESKTEKKIQEDGEYKADIEILFARIGAGGTQITQNELIYSAIKAYWPDYIKVENDRLAELYMPPFSLISLAFRLALSPADNGGFAGALSVKKVRQIAVDKDSEEYKSILELYDTENKESKLKKILERVDSWLTKDEVNHTVIPTVLRTGIARSSPDVYLLLMSIAKMEVEGKVALEKDNILLIRAIAFYLHWMVDKGEKGRAVSALYRELKDASIDSWNQKIKIALLELYARNKAIPLVSKESFNHLFGGKISSDSHWRTWEDGRCNEPWWPLWIVVAGNREMLLYAQRDYICQHFSNYDPAKLDMWEEYNRPWDYDHIIPQDWIYQYRAWRKRYSEYCNNWKDNNGNMAAIPFETNRAKSNGADWQEYIDNRVPLLVDDEIEKYNEIFNPNLTESKEQAQCFAQKTFERLCKIYSEIYDLLAPVDVNEGDTLSTLNNGLTQRRDLFIDVSNKLDGKIYYVYNEKEYDQLRNEDWTREWMSAGVVTENGYFAAITIQMYSDYRLADTIEIGLRRVPKTYKLTGECNPEILEEFNSMKCKPSPVYEMQNSSWWHISAAVPIDTSVDNLVSYLNELVLFASTKLK